MELDDELKQDIVELKDFLIALDSNADIDPDRMWFLYRKVWRYLIYPYREREITFEPLIEVIKRANKRFIVKIPKAGKLEKIIEKVLGNTPFALFLGETIWNELKDDAGDTWHLHGWMRFLFRLGKSMIDSRFEGIIQRGDLNQEDFDFAFQAMINLPIELTNTLVKNSIIKNYVRSYFKGDLTGQDLKYYLESTYFSIYGEFAEYREVTIEQEVAEAAWTFKHHTGGGDRMKLKDIQKVHFFFVKGKIPAIATNKMIEALTRMWMFEQNEEEGREAEKAIKAALSKQQLIPNVVEVATNTLIAIPPTSGVIDFYVTPLLISDLLMEGKLSPIAIEILIKNINHENQTTRECVADVFERAFKSGQITSSLLQVLVKGACSEDEQVQHKYQVNLRDAVMKNKVPLDIADHLEPIWEETALKLSRSTCSREEVAQPQYMESRIVEMYAQISAEILILLMMSGKWPPREIPLALRKAEPNILLKFADLMLYALVRCARHDPFNVKQAKQLAKTSPAIQRAAETYLGELALII